MRIAVLGTGIVGRTLGSALVDSGHRVVMGSRNADNEHAMRWAGESGDRASVAEFATAVEGSEMVFLALPGLVAAEVVRNLPPASLAGVIVVDVTNPLDFSGGFPPTVLQPEGLSVAEHVQISHPQAKVLKALNTMNASVMVDPRQLSGHHILYLCGDDAGAKATLRDILVGWGWADEEVLDLGDITAARAMEGYLPLWLRTMQALDTSTFNVNIVR